MSTPNTRLGIYSHALLRQPSEGSARWRVGYLAAEADQPGSIRVSPAIAEQICRDLEQVRTEMIYQAAARTECFQDAVIAAEATLPRLSLYRRHLIADWRHVAGALFCAEREPDGWYTIGLGLDWRQVTADRCQTVWYSNAPSVVMAVAAYQDYVGRYADATTALLALADRAGIAVAYLDRHAIEAASRPLADDEWDRITLHLDSYDEHVSGSGDLNSAFLDQLFTAADIQRYPDEHTDLATGVTDDHDGTAG